MNNEAPAQLGFDREFAFLARWPRHIEPANKRAAIEWNPFPFTRGQI
jgi:hypothetical protein